MKKKIRPIFKCHGGKNYLIPFIINHFPENYEQMEYVEPYVGGGSLFLNKKPSLVGEAINDLDKNIIAIYKVIREDPDKFAAAIKKITYSERVFDRELKKQGNNFDTLFENAVNEFVVRRMSRGGMKKSFAWSDRLRGGQPGDVNAWETIASSIPIIADRLKNTLIFNENALTIIKAFNNENCLLYCDPPYLPETRVSKSVYAHEMTEDDHIELSEKLMKFNGKVIISGYPSMLYNRLYNDWKSFEKKIVNHSSQQKKKEIKTEVLWVNY